MSDELFEVAFSGQIADGASIEQVKAKVAVMFKADGAKLAQLFSGKRVVIKKNIDQSTASKYKTALSNAGAVCEIKSLSADMSETVAPKKVVPAEVVPEKLEAEKIVAENKIETLARPVAQSAAVAKGGIPPAPQTSPLGINANEISDLSVSLAPVGSELQDEHQPVKAADIDVSGMDVAPAGSDLGQQKKEEKYIEPDINGLSLTD